MKRSELYLSACLGALFIFLSAAHANSTKNSGCLTAVPLSKTAEMQEGGSMHESAMAGAAMAKSGSMEGMDHDVKKAGMQEMQKDESMAGMKHEMSKEAMPGMQEKKSMAEMGGAHEVHLGQFGGVFYMAPNKTHHIEAVFSKECGLSLVLFNAHTQPINTSRFQAIVRYLPEDEDEFEAIRFLTSNTDNSLLKAVHTPDIKGPYDIELYVQFPGDHEPEMFTIPVAH